MKPSQAVSASLQEALNETLHPITSLHSPDIRKNVRKTALAQGGMDVWQNSERSLSPRMFLGVVQI